MFQAKPPFAPPNSGDQPGEGLCAITWSDLVARLDAARDLRRQLSLPEQGATASFDAFCAHHLAMEAHGAQGAGKRSVNPDDLAHGKALGGSGLRDVDGEAAANREK